MVLNEVEEKGRRNLEGHGADDWERAGKGDCISDRTVTKRLPRMRNVKQALVKLAKVR